MLMFSYLRSRVGIRVALVSFELLVSAVLDIDRATSELGDAVCKVAYHGDRCGFVGELEERLVLAL